MEKDNEKTLKNALNGDIIAFQNLFIEFQNPLKSYLYRLVTDRNVAEDLAHDTFVKAFDKLGTFKGNSSLKTWVFQIATHLAYDHLRKYKRWKPDAQDQAKALALGDRSVYDAINLVSYASGETATFFVCFHPNGFLPFSTMPIKDMENTAIPLEKLFGKDGQDIEQKILNAHSTSERINLIETFLLNRLTETETIDHIVKSTVETILTANGQLSIDTLSKQNSINRRQLLRKFSSTIGLSPKQLSKTIRIQTALKSLLTKEVTSLTDLAYENEYFDQAHFIKDFKEFTGLTPKEFYGDHLKMSLIFDSKE